MPTELQHYLVEALLGLVACIFWREIGALHRRDDEERDARKESAKAQGERIGEAESALHAVELTVAASAHLADDVAITRAEVAGIARKIGSVPATPAVRPRSPSRPGT